MGEAVRSMLGNDELQYNDGSGEAAQTKGESRQVGIGGGESVRSMIFRGSGEESRWAMSDGDDEFQNSEGIGDAGEYNGDFGLISMSSGEAVRSMTTRGRGIVGVRAVGCG
jgi:hypothetical protein